MRQLASVQTPQLADVRLARVWYHDPCRKTGDVGFPDGEEAGWTAVEPRSPGQWTGPMCYSAEASFAASGVLAASSVAIHRIPKEKASVPLAFFPAIFAAHQFTEGVLWLQQDGDLPDTHEALAVWAYALIAYVLWPSFVPFAAFLTETVRKRRAIILVCQTIGLGVGVSLLLSMVRSPVQVSADCCHLIYQVRAPEAVLLPYLIAVSVPFLASSKRSLVLFGAGILVSFAAAAVAASAAALPSVWCFFAALLSAGLYLYFRKAARKSAHQPGMRTASGVLSH